MGIGTGGLYVGASAVKAAADAALPLPVLEVKSSLLLDAASGLHTVRWGKGNFCSCLLVPVSGRLCTGTYICMYTYVHVS